MRQILAAAVVVLGCAEEPAPAAPPAPLPSPLEVSDAASLYGLQVGQKWTFLRSGDELRWKEITGCEDVMVLDPVSGEPRVVRAYVRENRGEFGTTSVHYLVVDDEGVRRVRRDDVDEGDLEMIATYDPAGLRVPPGPFTAGEKWSFSLITGEFSTSLESRGYSETSAVDEVIGEETLTVFAGNFDVVTIQRRWDANNPHDVLSSYAPGIGEVRETTEWPNDPVPQIEELVAYTLGFGSCDGTPPLQDVACDEPLLECDRPWAGAYAGCTDPRVDFANCGTCGTVCASGVCAGGRCVEGDGSNACLGTAVACGGACVFPARDHRNCGECGNVCPGDEICDRGECTCPPGTDACGAGCVDVLGDPENCGACGVQCGGDTPTCDKGVCVATCLSVDLDICGDECVDLAWDPNHCGDCESECGDGHGTTTCMAGACVTCEAAGLTNCDDDCVELPWSDKHCGACGAPCGEGEVCVEGECQAGDGTCTGACEDPDEICCGGACHNPRTSDPYCGGCAGAVCEGGCTEACRDGACTPVDCGGGDD